MKALAIHGPGRDVLRSTFVIAYSQRIIGFTTNLISTIVLARLLGPKAFGLAAIAAVFMNFLVAFRDFGLTSVTIQRDLLPDAERDALFWYNAYVVAAMTGVALLLAPLVALFYGNSTVGFLMALSSIAFAAGGVSAQHAAILRRNLAYGSIFIAETGATLLGAIVAIAAAMILRNAYAIVLGAVVQSCFSAATFFLLGNWTPGRAAPLARDIHLLGFGGRVASYTACNYLANNVGTAALGMFSSPSSAGFYNRAQTLYEMPRSFVLGPFLQVQYVLLCRDARDVDRSRTRYMALLRVITLLFIPGGLVLPVIAHDLVLAILGDKWSESGRVLAFLSPAMVALGATALVGQYLTSLGKVTHLQRWGFADLVIRGGGALVGSIAGPVGAAAGFSFATLFVATPIMIWLVARSTAVSTRDQAEIILPAAFIGLACCGMAAFAGSVASTFGIGSPTPRLIIMSSATSLTWLLCLASNRDRRRDLASLRWRLTQT